MLPTAAIHAQKRPDSAAVSRAKGETLCNRDRKSFDHGDNVIDAQHPKYFVEVSEVSSRGVNRMIHTSIPFDSGPERIVCQRVNAPIDIDSKVVLRINHSFLIRKHFEGKFAVSARVDAASGSRAVEVPGYSVIGKATEGDPVRIADLSGLRAAMVEIRRERLAIEVGLKAAATSTSRATEQIQAALTDNSKKVNALRQQIQKDSIQYLKQLGASRALVDSGRLNPQDTAGLGAQSVRLATARDSLINTANDLRDAQAALRNDSIAAARSSTRQFLIAAQQVLAERQHGTYAVRMFTAAENAALVRAFARAQHRLPQLITRTAVLSDSLWGAIAAARLDSLGENELNRWSIALRNFQAALEELSATDDPIEESKTIDAFGIDAMRDAEINVRQTGAQVGDILVITVADTVGDPSANRTLEVRMPVREFGFVRRVSDAVLLMYIPGVDEGADIAAAQTAANLTSVGSTLNFPLRLRGAPSAGVTFGWTYLPRLDDDYAALWYPLRSVFNWLRPGIGMNASVVSVAHKVLTITPNKPVTESAQDPEIGYTLGIVGSLFEGAIQTSVGKTLTGDKSRWYTGIGISFLAATEKAKELFKGLAQ
jgi:hypothetical protein